MKYNKLGKTEIDVSVICLGTMTWGEQNTEKEAWAQLDFALDKDFRDAIEGSLRRLQTDYIDLYQIHWPERATNFFGKRGYTHQEGWEDNMKMRLEILHEYINKGAIKYIGISNETAWGTMNYLKLSELFDLPRIATVQNPYNLLNRTYEQPLAFGRLTDKYIDGTAGPESRLNKYKHFARYNTESCLLATQKYYEIAQSVGLSLAQLSLAWVNQQQFVTSNIIGATNLKQLEENIATHALKLDEETVKRINEVQELLPNPAP